MKRITTLFLCFFLLVGCSRVDNEQVNNELEVNYFNYIEAIENQDSFENSTDDFELSLITNTIEPGSYRQDLILNNVKSAMHNIEIVARIHDGDEYTYTSLGVLENEHYTITNNETDHANNIYKGVNLSALTDNEFVEVSLVICYYNENDFENLEVRYFKIDNAIR